MKKVETNTTPQGALREKADALLIAAMEYWDEYHRKGLSGAVVWVRDTEGRMVVLTRGEYRDQLMQNIENLHREEERLFDYGGQG